MIVQYCCFSWEASKEFLMKKWVWEIEMRSDGRRRWGGRIQNLKASKVILMCLCLWPACLCPAPEKRQRVPSAYNRFIKWVIIISTSLFFCVFFFFFFFCIIICEVAKFEANVNIGPTICRDEIQRIKAGNPDISHREAFSAAAKNVRSMRFFLGFLATLPN
jgi:hypothetical protein